jgi:hypothetical protein
MEGAVPHGRKEWPVRSAERSALRQHTLELLVALGKNANEVGWTLEQAGVRGLQGQVSDCPISRYLAAVIGGETQVGSVRVTALSVEIRSGRWARVVRIASPEPVKAFVLAFDAGVFSGLISKARDRHPTALADDRARTT